MRSEETYCNKALFIKECNKIDTNCVWFQDAIDDFDSLSPSERKESLSQAILLSGTSDPGTRNERNLIRWEQTHRIQSVRKEIQGQNRSKKESDINRRNKIKTMCYFVLSAACLLLCIPLIQSAISDFNHILNYLFK